MNFLIVSEFTECTYEEFEDRMQFEILEKYDIKNFTSEWITVKVNDHKSVIIANVTDFDKFNEFIDNNDMQQFNKDIGRTDTNYKLERS